MANYSPKEGPRSFIANLPRSVFTGVVAGKGADGMGLIEIYHCPYGADSTGMAALAFCY